MRLGLDRVVNPIVLFIIFALTFIGPINSGDFEQSFVTNSISTSIKTIVSIKQSSCVFSVPKKNSSKVGSMKLTLALRVVTSKYKDFEDGDGNDDYDDEQSSVPKYI